MYKKILSLLIIFVAIFSLVFIFFANKLITKIFVQPNTENVLECSHAVDRSGNIYYILKEQNQSFLISLDSTGRQVYKKDISEVVGEDCIFDNIYVDRDKTLFLTVYKLLPDTPVIKQVGVHMFRDDGSFVAQIFKENVEQFYDSKFRLISKMSDDDRNIYFGFLNANTLDVFTYEKGSKEPIACTNEYPLGDIADKINAFLVLPTGEAIFSLEGGTLLKKSGNDADISYQFNNKVIVDSFWFAGNQFYCRDAVSGNIYVSTLSKLDPAIVVNGNKVISNKEGIQFGQLDPIVIGNVGNVMGILEDNGVHRIFSGGFAFLPEIGKTETFDRKDLTFWFLLAGIIVGTIILSLLLWDFYCNFLHMRLSILYRQAFLVILVIFLSLHFLINYLIIPKAEEMQRRMYLTEQLKAGQIFIAAYKGFAADSGSNQLDIDRSGAFFNRFRENLSFALPTEEDAIDATTRQMLNTSNLNFMIQDSGQYIVVASNNRYEAGYPAVRMGYGKNFIEEIKKAETNTITSYETMTSRGKGLCVLMPTGLTLAGSPVTLSLVAGLENLDKDTSNMAATLTNLMRLIGLVLIVLSIVVEYFNVFNVRKLKKGVDQIAAGDYGREIDVHSGDEIEDLSDSITALSLNMLSTKISLDKLNASYYRFVPLRFLEILGETQIENVGKGSQRYKENMVMLFLRFKFLTSRGERSEEIFANINNVFENVVPVVSESKGTVYNFLPDGFNAVFEGDSQVVLQVALRIREVLSALNRQRQANGQDEVDIRIFITKGNIMLGFVGDEKRMEAAAISNEARKAEPIIQLCFDSEIYIACTAEIQAEQPHGAYRNREIGEVMIQEEKVRLFDLYDGDPYTLLKVKEVHADKFELGVNLFRKGNYVKARQIFMDIIKYSSQDGAARNYMYIAEHNLRSQHKQSTYTTIYELERMR